MTSLQIQLEIVCFIREESSVWFGKSVIFIDYDISNHTTGYIQCVIDESVAGSFKLPFIWNSIIIPWKINLYTNASVLRYRCESNFSLWYLRRLSTYVIQNEYEVRS